LYTQDFNQEGFSWIDCNDNNHSVVSFIRRDQESEDFLVIVCNFTPQPHSHYRIGVPEPGFYTELFNSDSYEFGGSNMGNLGGKWTDEWWFHNYPYSIELCLPPLGVLYLKLDRQKTQAAFQVDAVEVDEAS
jgi:1,4-alpha-glucan branching enzyme